MIEPIKVVAYSCPFKRGRHVNVKRSATGKHSDPSLRPAAASHEPVTICHELEVILLQAEATKRNIRIHKYDERELIMTIDGLLAVAEDMAKQHEIDINIISGQEHHHQFQRDQFKYERDESIESLKHWQGVAREMNEKRDAARSECDRLKVELDAAIYQTRLLSVNAQGYREEADQLQSEISEMEADQSKLIQRNMMLENEVKKCRPSGWSLGASGLVENQRDEMRETMELRELVKEMALELECAIKGDITTAWKQTLIDQAREVLK